MFKESGVTEALEAAAEDTLILAIFPEEDDRSSLNCILSGSHVDVRAGANL